MTRAFLHKPVFSFIATLVAWIVAWALASPSSAFAQDQPSAQSTPHGASGAVLVPPSASAQPAPPQVVRTPPVLKRDDGAEYPKQALDDGIRVETSVMLILEVDTNGLVRKATVDVPVGHGFDEAALAAGQKLVFEPATKDGKPVAARIRFKYTFPAPPSALEGRVLDRATDAPIAGAQITATDPDGHAITTTSGPDGRWELHKLKPGHYSLEIASGGYTVERAELDLVAGSAARVTQRMSHATPNAAVTPLGGTPAPSPSASAAPADEPETVEVKGTRPAREVTVFTIDQREMERIPGTNGDALKSLLNLPGVARPPGFAGILIVRGSAPQDTQIFVDGTPIPIVYHFGGLSSVVPSEMLQKIDFYPGNFSAQYGRAMGGIVDVGIKSPTDKIHALAQADFIDARALVEGPIGDGWKFAVAARRSYFDLWLKPVLESATAGVSAAPVYYDYQALIQKDFNSHESLRALFFGSDDKLAIFTNSVNSGAPTLTGGISSHQGFYRFQLRFLDKLDKDTELRAVGAVGEDYVDFAIGSIFLHVAQYPITSRIELARRLAPGMTINFGVDMFYAPYSVDAQLPPLQRPGQPPSGPFGTSPAVAENSTGSSFMPAVYTELEIVPWAGARIVPGLRLDYTQATQAWDLAPRFIMRQDLQSDYPRTTLKGGAGMFFQPPQVQETDPVFGTVGLVSNRAIHYDLGVERELTRQIDVSFEGFYKQLDYLTVQSVGSTGSGRAFGTELLIRYKPDARFFGWLAYTLSRSERRDGPGDPLYLSEFDQTHILTVLGSYRLGRGWELGARFRLVSGNPYTPSTYGFYDENIGSYLALTSYPLNGSRLPPFHQLDVRVDKTWKYENNVKFSMYLDIQNVYDQQNIEGISYDYNYTHSTFVNGLPIIPSFGARLEY
jgi:TonB family protein